ncbi:hypothetical protein BJ878DRAFT_570819, partial [Calycina marina]
MFQSANSGTKAAVVATTTEDSSTCVFANYNGPNERPQKCGYSIIRPSEPNKEMLTWEMARASSAAPPYCKSFRGFQDGGLGGHNNPINLALWEQDALWCRDKRDPDIVLSLGTGYKRPAEPSTTAPPSTLEALKTRCIPRLFRSFMNFFVGETRWQELQNNLP